MGAPSHTTTLEELYARHAKVLEGVRSACAAHPEITEAEQVSAAWVVVNYAYGWREFRFWADEDFNGHKGWALSLYAAWLDMPASERRAA